MFGYINKILADWHRKGIKTLAEAVADSSSLNKPTNNDTKNDQSDLKLFEQFMKS